MALKTIIIILILLSLLIVSGIEGCEQKEDVGLEDAFSPGIFEEINKINPPKNTEPPFGIDPPKSDIGYDY